MARKKKSNNDSIPLARKSFARRLRVWREMAGYETARSFADALGLEENTYTRYERAETEPKFDTLLRICQLLNVTPDVLLLGKIGETVTPSTRKTA